MLAVINHPNATLSCLKSDPPYPPDTAVYLFGCRLFVIAGVEHLRHTSLSTPRIPPRNVETEHYIATEILHRTDASLSSLNKPLNNLPPELICCSSFHYVFRPHHHESNSLREAIPSQCPRSCPTKNSTSGRCNHQSHYCW